MRDLFEKIYKDKGPLGKWASQAEGYFVFPKLEGQISNRMKFQGKDVITWSINDYLGLANHPEVREVDAAASSEYGSVIKKYHETREFDANEIYPYRIEGLGKNLIPSATDFDVIDEFIKVTDEDSAHTARELAHKEGIFGGYTSGAVVQAVKQLQEHNTFKKTDMIVMIFPDHGSRYMSKVFSDQWMEDQGFMDEKHKPSNKPIEFVR